MIRNYLKVAWRTLRKDPVPTAINVGGLAIGMACCLWLMMFVEHEWAYDRFHEDAERIVRINQKIVRGDGSVSTSAIVPPPLGPALESSVPEVDTVVRLNESTVEIRNDGRTEERKVLFADPGFFDLFTFPLVTGNPDRALSAPNQIVVTESEARRLFGKEEVVGKTLTVEAENETREVQISGVAKEPPAASSIRFSFVLPMSNVDMVLPDHIRESWTFSTMRATFARLAPEADVAALEASLDRVVANHYENPEERDFLAQPLLDVHHATEISGGLVSPTDPQYAYILGAIAFVILGIAIINFVTLSLGRSAGRGREVGVRKATGATRTQLGLQFWCEAVLVCGLALLVGVLLARAGLPVVQSLIPGSLPFAVLDRPLVWVGIVGLVLGVGLLAGGYPAWVLARKEAAPVLRGQEGRRMPQSTFSRALVVVQFALSVGLVASAFIMSHQLRYMTETDLGYAEAPIVTLRLPEEGDDPIKRFEALRQEAQRHPSIHSVTGSAVTFGNPGYFPMELKKRTGAVVRASVNLVETNYVETMGLTIVAGRSFEKNGTGILVNEQLVEALDLETPLGTTLSLNDPEAIEESLGKAPIIGIVKNYHVHSLKEQIPPLILAPHGITPLSLRYVSARLQPGRTGNGLAALASTWHEIIPGHPLRYTFLQDRIEGQYEAERHWRTLVGYASLLALLIACFGVFGLAALEVSRRRTEIGIRKVVGASAVSLVALLSKDLARLVALGAVLAVPLAYLAMQRWLETFAYHVEPAWWVFAGAGGIVVVVALATASYHTLRAAWMDPVVAIRQE